MKNLKTLSQIFALSAVTLSSSIGMDRNFDFENWDERSPGNSLYKEFSDQEMTSRISSLQQEIQDILNQRWQKPILSRELALSEWLALKTFRSQFEQAKQTDNSDEKIKNLSNFYEQLKQHFQEFDAQELSFQQNYEMSKYIQTFDIMLKEEEIQDILNQRWQKPILSRELALSEWLALKTFRSQFEQAKQTNNSDGKIKNLSNFHEQLKQHFKEVDAQELSFQQNYEMSKYIQTFDITLKEKELDELFNEKAQQKTQGSLEDIWNYLNSLNNLNQEFQRVQQRENDDMKLRNLCALESVLRQYNLSESNNNLGVSLLPTTCPENTHESEMSNDNSLSSPKNSKSLSRSSKNILKLDKRNQTDANKSLARIRAEEWYKKGEKIHTCKKLKEKFESVKISSEKKNRWRLYLEFFKPFNETGESGTIVYVNSLVKQSPKLTQEDFYDKIESDNVIKDKTMRPPYWGYYQRAVQSLYSE